MSRPDIALVLVVSVLLAGCGGFLDGSDVGDSPPQYGIAVQNEGSSPQTIGVRVNGSLLRGGDVPFNRSRTLDSGELWHVANLSATEYADRGYAIQFLVDGGVEDSVGLSYEHPRPNRDGNVTTATLFVHGGESSGTHTCVGQGVTCYREKG